MRLITIIVRLYLVRNTTHQLTKYSYQTPHGSWDYDEEA